jgi:hypothetical protein
MRGGEIKYLGASIGGDVLRRCIDSGDFQVVQVGYHYWIRRTAS